MELDEEAPPTITTRANYPSAEAHAAELTKTFEEERALGMVEGPFTAEQAARACNCRESDLRPGPMAAIEELDKIRTIFDGSVCHQNDYIRANTKERTTAPMVHDAWHALHWLRWSSSQAPWNIQSKTFDVFCSMKRCNGKVVYIKVGILFIFISSIHQIVTSFSCFDQTGLDHAIM